MATYAQLNTPGNRRLVTVKVRQIMAGLKQTKSSTGISPGGVPLKYNYAGLTLRLKDVLADFLTRIGTAIPGSTNPDNRTWPTNQDNWIDEFVGINLNPAVRGSDIFTNVGLGGVWNKDTGAFKFHAQNQFTAPVNAHAAAIAKDTKTLTSIIGTVHLIQVFQSGRVNVVSSLIFATNPTGWNADAEYDIELSGENTSGIILTMALFSVECFYTKTIKATTATGSPTISGTGTGATQSVQAPFPYRTANSLVIIALDGTPGPND